jgi:hypothetical protein
MNQYNSPTAASYAALVMYAWDMCNADFDSTTPPIDPRIQASGWQVLGYVIGNDHILAPATGSPDKKHHLAPNPIKKVCYGYLACNQSNEYIVAIRGTDGIEEWIDDCMFLQKTPQPPLQGKVDSGFYDIFTSLQYQALGSSLTSPLANGIATTIQHHSITVLGHSLGSTLATYLSAELASLCEPQQIATCLFASPKPGNKSFATYFEQLSVNYEIFNYKPDLVPKMPPLDYSALGNITLLTLNSDSNIKISSSKACCHHLTTYIALLDTAFFQQIIAAPSATQDDKQCATCVTLEEAATTN